MKHYITTAEAVVILSILEKVKKANRRSPVMMAAIDIDKHDIKKCEQIIKNLGK